MYIPNADTQHYPLCRSQLVDESLDTQLNEPTNHNPKKLTNLNTFKIS